MLVKVRVFGCISIPYVHRGARTEWYSLSYEDAAYEGARLNDFRGDI